MHDDEVADVRMIRVVYADRKLSAEQLASVLA